jgi:hypothetical protein
MLATGQFEYQNQRRVLKRIQSTQAVE